MKVTIKSILIYILSFTGFSCLLIMPDYEPPNVSIISPTGGYVSEIVTINCEITDNSSLSYAQLWINNDSTNVKIPSFDETGNLIESFEEIKDSYVMTWNTRWIEDGIYYLHVRAYDGNGNMGQSEEIIVGVDNSTSSPNTISITSIELEERNYKINWERSEDDDFKKYTLQHLNPWIDFFHYNEIDLITTTEQDCTSFIHFDIDATLPNNYYRIKVYDNLDFVSLSLPFKVEEDSYPESININSATYDNNSIIISWDSCDEIDFLSYELYESYDNEMNNSELIYNSNNRMASEFIREGIYDNETRYYQLDVIDIWNQKTSGEILEANAFTRFYKAFGGINDEAGFDVISQENGFIITGYTKSFGNGDKDGFVMKLDSEGNQKNYNTFGSLGLDVIEDGIMLVDSSFAFVGRTEVGNGNAKNGWFIKTDKNGNPILENNFGSLNSDRLNAITINNNNQFAAVGSKAIEHNNSIDFDIWLIEIDHNGLIINEYTYGGSNYDYGKDIYPISVGGYILLGETLSYGSGGFDIYLVKINTNGEIEWTNTLPGTTSNESSKKIIHDRSGGGYYILMKEGGNSSNPVCIVKIDINGNELWRQYYGYTQNDNAADMVDIGNSSDILLVFGTTYINNNGDLWFFKVNSSNGEIFDENIFSDGSHEDRGFGIDVVSDDGGFILVGETRSYGEGGKDVIVIKTDPYGNTVGYENR